MRVHEGTTRFLLEDKDVRVRTRINHAQGGKVLRITSVIVRQPDLALIMAEIQRVFADSPLDTGILLAGQLSWKNGKRQKWISPKCSRFLEICQQLRETRQHLEFLRNNGAAEGSEVRFFEKAERIAQGNLLFDCGVHDDVAVDTEEIVRSEILNFEKGFNIAF